MYPIAVSLVPSFSASFVFFVSFSPAFPLVKSIAVVVVGVVVVSRDRRRACRTSCGLGLRLGQLCLGRRGVFVFGVLDPFAAVVTFGAFVTFAVVFVVFGDGAALGEPSEPILLLARVPSP